jgi:L-asparagine transporter-like permease
MDFLYILVISLIILTTFGVIYFSIMKRRVTGYRQHLRQMEYRRHLHQAWLNIFMGGLFISIAVLLILTPDYRLWRIILISLIFLLGCINLYAGIRNYRQLNAHQKNEQ